MRVSFATLGCRVNQYESEAMAEKFKREGYEIGDFSEVCDVYVINTCTVTNMGDKKSRQIIGRARRLNENAIIAVVGCYSQMQPKEVSEIEGVNVVLGTRNKGDIVYWVNKAREEGKNQTEVSDVLKNKVFEDLNIEEYIDKSRAFLKIQDGCNRFCSYCLIPYARGAVCSKDPQKIIDEVNSLSKHGFKEIILSGIHIASYGIDLKEEVSLIDILEKIDSVAGIERIRIGSIDPTFFTEGVIERLKKIKKLCPHFHLSLQSGCDETLKRMNRRYTSKEYRDIVEALRANLRDVSITTDVIVGFPGETDSEFDKTYKFLKEIKLSKMHIFKFSPRKGTRAMDMKDQVDGNKKDKRSKLLLELNEKNEKEFISQHIGKALDVLFEQEVPNKEGYFEGYTRNYIKVIAPFDRNIKEKIIGEIKGVKLISGEMEKAEAQIIS